MRTLLIGDMEKIENLYWWLSKSKESFEVELIISSDELESKKFSCPIIPLDGIERIKPEYEIVFICSSLYKEIKDILVFLGMDKNSIFEQTEICKFLSKREIMNYHAKKIFEEFHKEYISENIRVGEFTYGVPRVVDYGNGTKLSIGKFCSIADNVLIDLGGEHRSEWCTTYPFNVAINEFKYIKGQKSKGDITIGNDVWLARECKILSGVNIGNGSVIANSAVVTKDVEPYSIVGASCIL